MKITLQTVVDALAHCSDKQEKELLEKLNSGLETWAGVSLGEIIRDHVDSVEEGIEPDFQNPSVDGIHSDRLKGY